MKAFELYKIGKPYFGYEDIARVRDISLASAKVTASRYVRQGLLLRFKKNLYVLREKWNAASREDKFRLANLGQSPSYISFMSALDYYEITTQVQRDFLESVAVKRTKEIQVNGSVFRYSKINETLYFGFKKEIEIRRSIKDCDFEETIAFSRFATKQVVLKAHTLNQTMANKISAFLDRSEIRDCFDIEFLLRRGIQLPALPLRVLIMFSTGFADPPTGVPVLCCLKSKVTSWSNASPVFVAT